MEDEQPKIEDMPDEVKQAEAEYQKKKGLENKDDNSDSQEDGAKE